MESTWDGEARRVSKYADNLEQLDNGVKVLPHGWQCSKCDKTDNLWLNLSDGTVLCGRKFFDGTGGNNHALEHFNTTGTFSTNNLISCFMHMFTVYVINSKMLFFLEQGIRWRLSWAPFRVMARLTFIVTQRTTWWKILNLNVI